MLGSLLFDWPREGSAATCTVQVSCPVPPTAGTDGLIEIHTSLAQSPVVKVPLHIELRLPAVAKPSLVYVGRIARDQRVERTVVIKSVRENLPLDLGLVDALPVPGLRVRLNKTDEAGTSWALVVVVDGALAEPGLLNQRLRIAIGGSDQSIEVPVYGNITE